MTATIDKPRLEKLYADEVQAKILKEFNLSNVSLAPKLTKITVNVGIGRFLDNQKLKPEIKDTVISTLTKITGQKPIMLMAKKSVANFKVREGAPSACRGSSRCTPRSRSRAAARSGACHRR